MTKITKPNVSTHITRYWFDQPQDQAHTAIWATVRALHDTQTTERLNDSDYLRMSGDVGVNTRGFAELSFRATPAAFRNDRLDINVVSQVINTLTSRIATKQTARPQFLSNGGNFQTKDKAKKLTKFAEGQFYELDIDALKIQMYRDAKRWGTGCLKFTQANGKICAERVIKLELYVDEVEGLYGKPSNLYQTKLVSKEHLIRKYPELLHEIQSAGVISSQYQSPDLLQEHIEVIEAWHLGDEETPGRHTICIESATLLDEDWNRLEFPFVFFRDVPRSVGFWGQGTTERLRGIQVEIRRVISKMSRLLEQHGTPWILAHRNDQIPRDHLGNAIGTIIRYTFQQPRVEVHQVWSDQMFQYLMTLYEKAFEIEGVSQMSATGQKEPGINAAVAMRERVDIESERFQEQSKAYQDCSLNIAKHLIILAKEIAQDEQKYSVRVPGKKFFDSIDWADIDLDEDEYIMKLYPISALPATPAGRYQMISEWKQDGLIDNEKALELMDMPDLERNTDLQLAGRKLIEKTIDHMMDTGKYIPPEPKCDLQYALQYATNALLQGRLEEYPEEHIDQISQYIDAVQGIMDDLQASQPQAPQQTQPQAHNSPPPQGAQ